MGTKMKELEHNISCSKVRAVIDDLMTDDLPPTIISHTAGCRECRDHASTNTRLRELIQDSHRVTAPADFDLRLRERLQNRTARRQSFWSFIPTPALAAAATFVVTAAITFAVLKHMHGETTPTNSPTGTIATAVNDNATQKSSDSTTGDNSTVTQPAASVSERNVPTTAAAFNTGRSSSKGSRASVETPTNTLLVSDGQRREQEVRVPQVVVGARSVVPRGSGKRPLYEPSVF
jgi:hypothetical protein